MEEKKVSKISLSTFFLIIALIVIIVMGIVIFIINNEKTLEIAKSTELQNQVNNLNNTISDLQGKINSISETINTSGTKNIETSQSNTTSNKQKDNIQNDYSKYFGTWVDNESNEFIVRNIGNDLITFTWSIYRIASIDDVTLPLKDNKAVLYYQGYDDSNYNGKNEDNEYYCRKAIIELNDSKISVIVENASSAELIENISQDKTTQFGGNVYVTPRQYNFVKK